ncbi:Protein CBG12529 [Caenorhabditis briggsae]|uniref:Uncharacterized protein n=2 Tax=Caenorhabditis briggsae TaxID=6238 RepID=A0AAE9DXD3_CAEBR|nr:Protein CBG12529 [Caenorhabditis briggsae]ULU12621.1 hypothetical protein L3Y34_015695 [Caenorhabditis briggsae]UMM13574.1 hypothetical protein L5515_001768 [Caenorhabditis briggsae]CAP31499.1 Protein CBG12529 [Caenorhabditis briggsae]
MSSFYDDMEKMKIEDFLGRIQHFRSYSKGSDSGAHCSDCTWTLSKLNVMYKKTAEYAKMRTTDDDVIEWNTLILEALDMPDESQTIKGPSPAKKPRVAPTTCIATDTQKLPDAVSNRIDAMIREIQGYGDDLTEEDIFGSPDEEDQEEEEDEDEEEDASGVEVDGEETVVKDSEQGDENDNKKELEKEEK